MFAEIPFKGGGTAYIAFAGFRLPDDSVLGPDAAWISSEKLGALTADEMSTAFWKVCPDVVIEIMSEYDSRPELIRKLQRYVRNGSVYAAAVDHNGRRVYELGTLPEGLHLDFEAIFDA